MARQPLAARGGFAYQVMKDALSARPVTPPRDWAKRVKRPQDEKELAAIRRSHDRGQPFGDAEWVQETARRLGLASTLRPVGGPKSVKKSGAREGPQ